MHGQHYTVIMSDKQKEEGECIPSVKGGIQDSTEYGKLSINAQSPRMDECSARREPAYAGSRRLGNLAFLADARKCSCTPF